MADRTQTFTTKIFLNDDQAKNKIRELEKSISTIRADMSKAADAGDWSKFNSLKKELNQSTKELNSMRTTAQSVEHVLNNLGSSSIKEIKRTVSAINKELASGNVARNSQEWKFLTEQLDRAKQELRNVNQANELVNVYTLDGKLVRAGVRMQDSLRNLSKGTYVVNGKVIIIGKE